MIPSEPKKPSPEVSISNPIFDTLLKELSVLLDARTDPLLATLTPLARPYGILLHGPPGVGKTFMAQRLAAALGVELRVAEAAELLSHYVGVTECNLRELFRAAREADKPCILFFDEIDAIAPRRDSNEADSSPMLRRAVTTLLTELDGVCAHAGARANNIVAVIAATNRPDALDEALRRPGRFDKEVPVSAPPRLPVLKALCANLNMSSDAAEYLPQLAEYTPGWTPSDLLALLREAAELAAAAATAAAAADADADSAVPAVKIQVKMHIPEALITKSRLIAAMKRVTPSSTRVSSARDAARSIISWDDIGGLEDVKREIATRVIAPLRQTEQCKRLGIRPPRGLLLFGPPGCSKTTVARALASTLGFAFFSESAATVYDSYVGESARRVREAFARARRATPAIIFFDELDAIAGSRDDEAAGASDSAQSQILTTLLNEMDGINGVSGAAVLVVGAANYPQRLDSALLRAGRLDRAVYLGPPTVDDRASIFRLYASRMPISDDVCFARLASLTPRASGAEIANMCREVALSVMRAGGDRAHMAHFEAVVGCWRPHITEQQLRYYEELRARFCAP